MAERPMWMEYADLMSKWTIPVAVLGATAWLTAHSSSQQAKDTNLRACIDKQFQLADFACKNGTCEKLTDAQGAQLARLTAAVTAVCKDANSEVTKGVLDQLKLAAASTNNALITAQVAQAAGTQPKVIKVPASQGTSAAASAPASSNSPPPAGAVPRPRLYVQISADEQRAAAGDLIKRLNQVSFRGQRLQALGPDLKPINRTQLRCVTRADCQSAPELASFVSSLMGEPVPVVDLSARYQRTSPSSAPYELWIAPGAIGTAGTLSAGE